MLYYVLYIIGGASSVFSSPFIPRKYTAAPPASLHGFKRDMLCEYIDDIQLNIQKRSSRHETVKEKICVIYVYALQYKMEKIVNVK